MRIILHADDFGFDDDTTAATIECFECGALTGASIMANMPATQQAVEYARGHDAAGFGVHLTFTCDDEERPVLPPGELPDLVDEHGRFLSPLALRGKALRNRLSGAQIEREMTAQIERVRDAGVPITHVDSHGHVHKFGPFRRAMSRVLPRLGITRVRSVQNVYLRKPFKSPIFWMGGYFRRRLAKDYRTTEHFFMPTTAADIDWEEPLLARINGATLEIGVHPGHDEVWRDQERQAIQKFARLARERGHELISWGDL